MHLTSFSIENYRSIREKVELNNIAAVEVFHGANNAGKSNLLGAMALLWALLRHDRFLNGINDPPPSWLFRRAELSLAQPPAPHHDTPGAPTQLHMQLHNPDLSISVSLLLQADPIEVVSAQLLCSGQPWRFEREVSPVEGVVPASQRRVSRASLAALSLPEVPFVLVNNIRKGPAGESWDQWLINQRNTDAAGAARGRYQQVEDALRRFVRELGPGQLSAFQHPISRGRQDQHAPVMELAWEGPDHRPAPFSEQGSGMRQMKDILCAVLGSPAPIVAIEEPETNLSEDAQLRLFQLLQETARRYDKQLLLTSHVYTFDSLSVRRVVRTAGATTIHRAPSAAAQLPDDASLPARINALHRAYASAGHPSAEFVSDTGILKLPRSVMEAMQLPELLVFAALEHGGFLAVPDSLLRQWRERLEAEE